MDQEVEPLTLGKLERANVRRAWPHEAHHLTPWLSQNLDRLSADFGIDDLELDGTEVTAGPYSMATTSLGYRKNRFVQFSNPRTSVPPKAIYRT